MKTTRQFKIFDMRILKITCIAFLVVTLTACPGSKDDGMEDDSMGGGDPGSVNLVFPENNTECSEGIVLNDTQTTIIFRWEALDNVDLYEINLTNLNSNITSKLDSDSNELAIVLDRGVPYEWFVASMAEGSEETANSATWRFFSQGLGTQNYAPFPAEAINPLRGASIAAATNIALQWNASDVDNDIADYEVLFGTETNPTNSLSNTPENTVNATIASGRTYYWRVITKDGQGNTSRSEIFDFQVQ